MGTPHTTSILLLSCVIVCIQLGRAQEDDFSSPIKCYVCDGPAEGSKCSDPMDKDTMANTTVEQCEHGICLKWTKYKSHVLQIVRTCSAKHNFHLTMIDGVCRSERNGNGNLCMCGKNLCNSSTRSVYSILSLSSSILSSLLLVRLLLFNSAAIH